MAENDYAVVIGIRTYPAMRSLQGPCLDAEAFQEWLVDPDKGNVLPANVRMLTTEDFNNPDTTNHPFADEVHRLFEDFVEEGYLHHKSGPPFGRRLYIYMAGHGFSEPGQMTQAALFTANAKASFAFNIAATTYAEWFRFNGVFDEIVLVMDCCRTTSLVSQITSPPLPKTTGSTRRANVRYFHAYAVSDGEAARERPSNGETRGIFTMALIEALDKATGDASGRLRGTDVSDYVHTLIGDIQTPDFEVKRNLDVVLLENRQPGLIKVGLRLDPFDGGETVVIQDGALEEAAHVVASSAEFEVQLKAGLYKAILDGTDRAIRFEVPSEELVVL